MNLFTKITLAIIVIIHAYIVYLEMFLWSTKKGIKIFNLKTKEFANQTKVLAANQGLYNGFLVFGILTSLYLENVYFVLYFCICVAVAGIYGAYSTKNKAILYIQTIPSIIAIISLVL